jgi:site-specific DNA recombinase
VKPDTSFLSTLFGTEEFGSDFKTDTVVNALAWARVSTDMQEERGLSLSEQLREIRQYAQKHKINIVAEFQEATSAYQKEDKRVEFHRMIARAKSELNISLILVHDLSRFSRDSLRARSLLRELREAGVRVVSLNDPELDPETVPGVYLEAITFAKNEAFSREVAFHTRKGCRANIRTRDPQTGWCYKNGGQPLWGFRSHQVIHGNEKRGRSNFKSVWILNSFQ